MKKLLLFLVPVLFIIGCSSKTAEEYKAAAEESLKKNDISKAVESYENLVEEYPNNEFAVEALYKIASIYQNKLIKDIAPEQSLEKASEKYMLLQEKYPRNEKAPLSLFMAAYIKANELKKYQEATDLYTLFLKKYPKHELAASAAQELEIMGMSPDEILKQKTAAGI